VAQQYPGQWPEKPGYSALQYFVDLFHDLCPENRCLLHDGRLHVKGAGSQPPYYVSDNLYDKVTTPSMRCRF